MPFKCAQVPSQSEILSLAEDWEVARRGVIALGDEGPDLDLNFDAIEAVAFQAAQAVIKGTIAAILEPADAETRGDPVVPAMPTSMSAWRPNHGNSSGHAAPRCSTTSRSATARHGRRDFLSLSSRVAILTRWLQPIGPQEDRDRWWFSSLVWFGGQDAWPIGGGHNQWPSGGVESTEEIGQEMAEKRDLKTQPVPGQDRCASAVIGVPRVAWNGCGTVPRSRLRSGPGSHEASWKEDKIAC